MKRLKNIEVRLNTDFFKFHVPKYRKVVYAGSIDKIYNYKFGEFEHKTNRFDHKKIQTSKLND